MRRRPKAVPRRQGAAPTGATGEVTGDGQEIASVQEPAGQAGPGMITVNDANFFDATAGAYTLVDFWAAWCGPCRSFAPIFKQAARDHTGPVRFASCNVDDSPKAASLVGIRGVPTLVAFGPDGSEIGRHVGAMSQRALDQVVAELSSTGG